MIDTYTTTEDDVLDAICFVHYGREGDVVAVLNANPGLAEYLPVLPAGLVIKLPSIPTATTTQTRRLWD
ncbi:MAG: phage tail protein [Thiothrix lacustris]|uniref:Phage tail protein n=1 Tax=Thiothrix lacustris TaxID=525917 RepID=A0A1Y1QY46_9GAMM|nr:MAG: phage tail protein [Thiothrix lacustris]